MPRLELQEGSSAKFWEIRVEGSSHTVRFGKLGTDGQTQTKSFASAAEAEKDAAKLVAAKKKKGYVEAGGEGASAAARPGVSSAKQDAEAPAPRRVGPHIVPPLVERFTAWFESANLPFRALGIEAIGFDEIDEGWDPELTPVLRRDGFVWFSLGEGSMVVVLQVAGTTPVALLDSEGGARLLATSVEELLHLWAKGETGTEMDEGEGLAALGTWLASNGIKRPKKATAFDLDRYLEGKDPLTAPVAAAGAGAPPGAPVEGLPPDLLPLLDLVGRRVDDPLVQAFAADVLQKKLPASTSWSKESDFIENKGAGIGVGVGHLVRHDAYPPIPKTKSAFVPYLRELHLRPTWKGTLPFGLSWDAGAEELSKALGAPHMRRRMVHSDDLTAEWRRTIDPSRSVEVLARPTSKGLSFMLRIPVAHPFVREDMSATDRVTTGIFVAWAIGRGLLDKSRFPAHEALFERVRAREARGTAFVDAALARGLWNDHFVVENGPAGVDLRDHTWRYFVGDGEAPGLRDDLRELFGTRKGPHGHDEPDVTDDAWDAVDRAGARFDERFAAYIQ